MTVRRREVYKCEVCGIVAEILDDGAGEPICCGQPMTLQHPNAQADDADAHRLLVESDESGLAVRVGPDHPADPKHFIQWIEINGGDGLWLRKDLAPGQRSAAVFPVKRVEQARAFCNRHGLWES